MFTFVLQYNVMLSNIHKAQFIDQDSISANDISWYMYQYK